MRFNNHKSRIRAHTRLSANEKLRDDLIYQHFNGPGHNGLDDISVQLIDQVACGKDLVDKEGEWAYRLKCLKPLVEILIRPYCFFCARFWFLARVSFKLDSLSR